MGTYLNGVFKSEDGGKTWFAAYNGLPEESQILSLAIDPQAPTTLYAASLHNGVYKSANGGETWSEANNGLTDSDIRALVIDPQTPSTLYAGTFRHGVFKSENGEEKPGPPTAV